MSYKMIVLDLDGTLMSSKNEILPKTKEALFKAQEQGVMIVLASGRPTYGMVKAAKELRLDEYPGYILSYNGGRIISVQTNEMIYDDSLTPEICHELYDLSREMNVNIMAYEDEAIITADDDQYIQKEAHINGMPINRVENFKDSVTFNSVKCLCTAEPEYLAQVEIKMKERLGNRLSITRSLPFFLEFMPQNITKAYSLQKLLEQQQEDLHTEKIKKLKTAIEYFDDILKSNEPNRYILECLIDKIWIYHDKSVKFELKPEISRLI